MSNRLLSCMGEGLVMSNRLLFSRGESLVDVEQITVLHGREYGRCRTD